MVIVKRCSFRPSYRQMSNGFGKPRAETDSRYEPRNRQRKRLNWYVLGFLKS